MRRGTAVPLKPLKHRYTLKERLKRRRARVQVDTSKDNLRGLTASLGHRFAWTLVKLKPLPSEMLRDRIDPGIKEKFALHQEVPNAPEANSPSSNDQANAGAEGTAPTSEPAREADRDAS